MKIFKVGDTVFVRKTKKQHIVTAVHDVRNGDAELRYTLDNGTMYWLHEIAESN